MSVSPYLYVVMPIVAFVMMITWIGLIFWADNHPGYGSRSPRPESQAQPKAGSVPDGSHEELPASDAALPRLDTALPGPEPARDAAPTHAS